MIEYEPMIKEAPKEVLNWQNPDDDGITILHIAVEHGLHKAAKQLIEAGASVNIRDSRVRGIFEEIMGRRRLRQKMDQRLSAIKPP